jgi:4-pyridoxolactonase
MSDRFAENARAPMRVSIMPAGSMLIDHSQLLWNIDPGKPTRQPVYGALIEHPGGLILLDTGFDIDRLRATIPSVDPHPDCGGPIASALKLSGVTFEDIDYVIHTHLHFDHVGADRFIRDATMFVHKEEMRHAKVPESFERLGYFDQQFDHPSITHELLEGDTEVLSGIFLLETPGHSAGHYSVLLRGHSGRELLFCGDAAYAAANLEQTIIPGFHLDPIECVRSIKRLQKLSEREALTVCFPHDMQAFHTYRVSPEHYRI